MCFVLILLSSPTTVKSFHLWKMNQPKTTSHSAEQKDKKLKKRGQSEVKWPCLFKSSEAPGVVSVFSERGV